MHVSVRIAAWSLAVAVFSTGCSGDDDRPPSLIIIFTDDQGDADVGVYGAEDYETPMSGEPGAVSPYSEFYDYRARQLHAVRSGQWKLHVPHGYSATEVEGAVVANDGAVRSYARGRSVSLCTISSEIRQRG